MKAVTVFAISVLLMTGIALADDEIILDDRTVDDVEAAFNAFTHMGEWLGFNMGDAPVTHPGGSLGNPGRPTDRHIQGIVRSPRSDPYPVFYVTRSGVLDDPDQLASLMVVRMYTRDTDGERLRSNRLSDSEHLANHAETISTPPPSVDVVVNNIEYPDFGHPGDVAMAGDILAVAMEKPADTSYPKGTILFYDCSDPVNPVRMDYELKLEHIPYDSYPWMLDDWPESKAGTLAFTRLPDKHYLLAVTAGDGDWLEFYRSDRTSFFMEDPETGERIEDPGFEFQPHTRLGKSSLEDVDHWIIDDGKKETRRDKPFQGISFIQQSDGQSLYLIAAYNNNGWSPAFIAGFDAFVDSRDILRLFEVTGYGSNEFNEADLTYVAQKGVRMRSGGGASWLISSAFSVPYVYILFPQGEPAYMEIEARMQANFLAGAGAYVSPTGELLYYATHHYNLAPGTGGQTSVSMAELRHRDVAHSGTCGPQFRDNHLGGPYLIPEASTLALDGTVFHVEPWVQMYQDTNYRGITWMVDWRDQDMDWYSNFDRLDGYTYECRRYNWLKPWIRKDGVNDCMDSFRWCGQPGSRLKIFKDKDYEDLKRDHMGNGSVQAYSSVGGFGDDATSVRLYWDAGHSLVPYEWDMDDDGEFDDAFDAEAVFHAGVGSSDNTVSMRYWHDSTETDHTIVTAEIEVYNVPPAIHDLEVDDDTPDEGRFIELTGRWTDPGASECSVTVDWGDGSSDTDPDNTGYFSFDHAYGDNGVYTIELCVSDQEDTVCESLDVTAYNVPPTATIDSIDQPNPHFILPVVHTLTFNGSFTDPGWLDTHTSLWDFGDGSDDPGTLNEENDPPDATGTTVTEHIYDDPGIYDILLTVTDDDGESGEAESEVTVLTAQEAVVVLQRYILALPDSSMVRNPAQRKRVLVRKLQQVIAMIDAGHYHPAIQKLRRDIRAKADGCLGGHPNNDWIGECGAQADVCMMIDDIVAYLQYLISSAAPQQPVQVVPEVRFRKF